MKVLKFGGTSVGTVASLSNVKNIVEAVDGPAVVVVSAIGGLTDRLIAGAEMARKGDICYAEVVETARRRHYEIIDAFIADAERNATLKERIDDLLRELRRLYDGIAMLGDLPEKTLAAVVSFGERMSSLIVASIIDRASYFHSPDFIKTEKWFNKNIADTKLTGRLIRETFGYAGFDIAVTGGFISTDRDTGEITNLGRGGSDYTAALIAANLDADVLEIWTDVNGFMTADPRLIKDAFVVSHMTFIESMELCTMGAKVIYPPTIYPVFHKNIPIRILNTFAPEAEGTWITDDDRPDDLPVKGISAVRNTTLIRVGAPHDTEDDKLNSRTLNAMAKNGVTVYLANSKDTGEGFSFAVSAPESGTAIKVLTDEFSPELSRGEVENITASYKLATIAVVGTRMRQHHGLTERAAAVLTADGVKVHSTSDGTSDTTIAIVVGGDDCDRAISLLHAHFFPKS